VLIEEFGTVNAFAFENHHRDSFRGGDVLKGISVDDEEIGVIATTNGSDSVVQLEEMGGV
jgi:hypothetical protein